MLIKLFEIICYYFACHRNCRPGEVTAQEVYRDTYVPSPPDTGHSHQVIRMNTNMILDVSVLRLWSTYICCMYICTSYVCVGGYGIIVYFME
jgi:hypothetical protein